VQLTRSHGLPYRGIPKYLLPWLTPSARFSDHVLKSLSKMPPCVSWGAPRIHAELLELGFLVSERAVWRFMPKKPVDPDAVKPWPRLSLCPALVVFTIDTSEAPHRASLPE
jgi:hypothetical protein